MKTSKRGLRFCILPGAVALAIVWGLAQLVPNEADPVAKADAGGSLLCPQGGICVIQTSNNSGCRQSECCAEGVTYCAGYSRSTHQFAHYTTSPQGKCMSQTGDAAPWCSYYECEGGALCSAGTCGINGEAASVMSLATWISHGACSSETK